MHPAWRGRTWMRWRDFQGWQGTIPLTLEPTHVRWSRVTCTRDICACGTWSLCTLIRFDWVFGCNARVSFFIDSIACGFPPHLWFANSRRFLYFDSVLVKATYDFDWKNWTDPGCVHRSIWVRNLDLHEVMNTLCMLRSYLVNSFVVHSNGDSPHESCKFTTLSHFSHLTILQIFQDECAVGPPAAWEHSS